MTEKRKESMGNVKLDFRFREGYIYFMFLIVETVYVMIIFDYIYDSDKTW